MTDARFPERWLNDRRIVRLSDAAFRLYVIALAWSVGNCTDGVLHDDDLTMLVNIDPARPDELGKAGLWQRDRDHWRITDYASTQTTCEQLRAAEQAREHERLSKLRRRAHKRGDHTHCTPELCEIAAARAVVRPDVRPDNTGQDRPGQARREYRSEEKDQLHDSERVRAHVREDERGPVPMRRYCRTCGEELREDQSRFCSPACDPWSES